jgi:alpha-L-arabinofuranosidase
MLLKPGHSFFRRAFSVCRRAIWSFFCATLLPGLAFAANVTVNVTSNLFPVASTAYGIHTSVYDNQNGNANLPSRLIESGVNTLRYSGGGYADIFHWSVNKYTPWQDGTYGYQGPNTDFGHFVGLLDNAHAQAVITVNFGSGQLWNASHTQLMAPPTNAEPPEAAAWVAYANGSASLYGTSNDIALGTDSQGNNWRTAGFWAKLRSSSVSVYQTWATAAGVYDATFNFLAINHPTPVGIKYWEIGNETFGTGYYPGNGSGNGYSVNYAVPYPYTSFVRQYNPALSPAIYGEQVRAFSLAMKAVDPTIKIGAVVSTPLGDYGWDVDNVGQHWTPQVLAQCATNIDFIIAHWYFYNGNNDKGNSLLPSVAVNVPSMINGTGSHTGTSSGLKDWINQYRPEDPTNVSIFITEFGYTGNVTNSINGSPIIGPVTALFDADSYATWMSYGVSNICFLEMNKTPFLGDSSSLTRGETFYAIKLLHTMAAPGDTYVSSTSDTSTVRVQAAFQKSGQVGLMLLNENRTTPQTVNVTITNASMASTGIQYQFGTNNFTGTQETPTSQPSSNSVSSLGNSFSLTLPPYSMIILVIPFTKTPPVLAAISNQTVNVGHAVAFTATATDTDQPPQILTFSLLNGPGSAMLNSNTGAFSWRPQVTDANTTNTFTLEVADNGSPSMSATQSFTVLVNPLAHTSLLQIGLSGGVIGFQISGDAGPDYAVQVSTNLIDWSLQFITNSPAMPFQWTDTNPAALPVQFYRIKAGPPLH